MRNDGTFIYLKKNKRVFLFFFAVFLSSCFEDKKEKLGGSSETTNGQTGQPNGILGSFTYSNIGNSSPQGEISFEGLYSDDLCNFYTTSKNTCPTCGYKGSLPVGGDNQVVVKLSPKGQPLDSINGKIIVSVKDATLNISGILYQDTGTRDFTFFSSDGKTRPAYAFQMKNPDGSIVKEFADLPPNGYSLQTSIFIWRVQKVEEYFEVFYSPEQYAIRESVGSQNTYVTGNNPYKIFSNSPNTLLNTFTIPAFTGEVRNVHYPTITQKGDIIFTANRSRGTIATIGGISFPPRPYESVLLISVAPSGSIRWVREFFNDVPDKFTSETPLWISKIYTDGNSIFAPLHFRNSGKIRTFPNNEDLMSGESSYVNLLKISSETGQTEKQTIFEGDSVSISGINKCKNITGISLNFSGNQVKSTLGTIHSGVSLNKNAAISFYQDL